MRGNEQTFKVKEVHRGQAGKGPVNQGKVYGLRFQVMRKPPEVLCSKLGKDTEHDNLGLIRPTGQL